MLSPKEVAEQEGRKLLEVFMGQDGVEVDYVVGFAHALLVVGAITPDRWHEVAQWAEENQ